jgi:hypothetical protein
VIKLRKYLPFIAIWLVNTVILYLAAMVAPQYFELGSEFISELPGALLSGLLVTLFTWAAKPIVESLKIKLKGTVNMFFFYWAANFVAIWLVARFASYTGFGITAYYWAFTLGFFVNISQWGMWQILKLDKLA